MIKPLIWSGVFGKRVYILSRENEEFKKNIPKSFLDGIVQTSKKGAYGILYVGSS